MQPYYVASTTALKKRITQFHKKLKIHTDSNVPLGWSRDFVARILLWDSWNALHQAHEEPFSDDQHRRKLFNRRFLQNQAQTKALQHASKASLSESRPEMSDAAIQVCVEALWHLRTTALLIPSNKKIAAASIPDEYWLDNTYVTAEGESHYDAFILSVIAPVVSRNGGMLCCTTETFNAYYRSLAPESSKINVLNLAVHDDAITFSDKPKVTNVRFVLDFDDDFWENFHDVWVSALQNEGIGEHVNMNVVANALVTYYRLIVGDKVLTHEQFDSIIKEEQGLGQLGAMLKGDLGDTERKNIQELDQIFSHGNNSSLSLHSPIYNASNAVSHFFRAPMGEKNVDFISIGSQRTSECPLLVIMPEIRYKTSSNGYLAGIINTHCINLRKHGFSQSPNGNKYDSAPPRVLALPYNGAYSPPGLGITTALNSQAGWGLVLGGSHDTQSWNQRLNSTCVATYMVNVGNYVDIIAQNDMLRYFKPKHKYLWQSSRHPMSEDWKDEDRDYHDKAFRVKHYPSISLA
jgi:hypothetical protein